MKINLKIWFKRRGEFGLKYRHALISVVLSLITTATEIFGLGIFLPILQYIRLDGDVSALVADSKIWGAISDFFEYFGLTITLELLLLIALAAFSIRQLTSYTKAKYNFKLLQNLVGYTRTKIHSLYVDSKTEFQGQNPIGKVINSIITETNPAVQAILAPIEFASFLIILIAYIVFLCILSLEMTIISSLFVFVGAFLPRKWINLSATTSRSVAAANSQLSTVIVERLRSPRLIRLCRAEQREKHNFKKLADNLIEKNFKNAVLSYKTEMFVEPLIISMSLFFIYFSYTYEGLSLEKIGLYLVIVLRLLPITKSLVFCWQKANRYIGSVETIEKQCSELFENRELDTGTQKFFKFKNIINVTNLSYRYPNKENFAIENLNLKIPKGKLTILVGASGSGKSTFIDTLLRLRDSSTGTIKFDDVDIRQFTLNSLRTSIAFLPQEPIIFMGSLKDHIIQEKDVTSDREIERALRLSGAKEFVEKLPFGIDSQVGAGGLGLSGGQRQRIDLARVLVQNAEILILDEPTSCLDSVSRNKFLSTIQNIIYHESKTIILVTHELSFASQADYLVVFKNGRIETSGSLEQVMGKSPWFAAAYKKNRSNFWKK